MPYHDASEPAKLQAYVSNYLLDSLATSYLETSGFHVWTKHTAVPPAFPFQLNTQDMDCFFPGLAAKYGVNKTIDVEYNLDALKNFVAKEADETLSMDGDITLKFWVNTNATKELAVQLKLNTLFIEFNAIIDGM